MCVNVDIPRWDHLNGILHECSNALCMQPLLEVSPPCLLVALLGLRVFSFKHERVQANRQCVEDEALLGHDRVTST